MLSRQRGFSLIELLVVIAIIGVLSSVVMASLGSTRAKGRDDRRISDIKQLQLALQLYYDANDQYPTALSALTGPGYIANLPTDPRTGASYQYSALRGAPNSAGTCASYHLGAILEIASAAVGSPLSVDKDAQAGGSYSMTSPFTNGPICTGASADFSGTDPIYDVRP